MQPLFNPNKKYSNIKYVHTHKIFRQSKRIVMTSTDKPEVVSHALSPEVIQETLKDIIDKVETVVPGKSEIDKKTWCAKRIHEFLEMFDNYVPIVGMLLDNPIVDDLQAQAVYLLVDWAWEKFHNYVNIEDKIEK